jgi:hypothetical protein
MYYITQVEYNAREKLHKTTYLFTENLIENKPAITGQI